MSLRLETIKVEMFSNRRTKGEFFGKNERYSNSEKMWFCGEHPVSGTHRIELKISTDTQRTIPYNWVKNQPILRYVSIVDVWRSQKPTLKRKGGCTTFQLPIFISLLYRAKVFANTLRVLALSCAFDLMKRYTERSSSAENLDERNSQCSPGYDQKSRDKAICFILSVGVWVGTYICGCECECQCHCFLLRDGPWEVRATTYSGNFRPFDFMRGTDSP
jgi:hypothetical protein